MPCFHYYYQFQIIFQANSAQSGEEPASLTPDAPPALPPDPPLDVVIDVDPLLPDSLQVQLQCTTFPFVIIILFSRVWKIAHRMILITFLNLVLKVSSVLHRDHKI